MKAIKGGTYPVKVGKNPVVRKFNNRNPTLERTAIPAFRSDSFKNVFWPLQRSKS